MWLVSTLTIRACPMPIPGVAFGQLMHNLRLKNVCMRAKTHLLLNPSLIDKGRIAPVRKGHSRCSFRISVIKLVADYI